METGPTASPTEQVRHAQGRSTADRSADGRQWADVLGPDGLPMANAAPGLRPVADGLLLLPHLASGWDVAEDSRRPPPEGPGPSQPQAQSLRGDYRQPVGQDRRKRGARGYDAGKKINGRKRHI